MSILDNPDDLYARWRDGRLEEPYRSAIEEGDLAVRQMPPGESWWRRSGNGLAAFRGRFVILWVNGAHTHPEDALALVASCPPLTGYVVRTDVPRHLFPSNGRGGAYLLPAEAPISDHTTTLAAFARWYEAGDPVELIVAGDWIAAEITGAMLDLPAGEDAVSILEPVPVRLIHDYFKHVRQPTG